MPEKDSSDSKEMKKAKRIGKNGLPEDPAVDELRNFVRKAREEKLKYKEKE